MKMSVDTGQIRGTCFHKLQFPSAQYISFLPFFSLSWQRKSCYQFMYSKLDDFLLGKKEVSNRLPVTLSQLTVMGNKHEKVDHCMDDGLNGEGCEGADEDDHQFKDLEGRLGGSVG